MKEGTAADNMKAVEAKMDALRSELLKFSEEQAQNDPQRLALTHSIMTIQEAMRTFLAIATARNR